VVGEGSEFWFTLPITALPDAPLTLAAATEGSMMR
jgi:hypothetical protein